MQSKGLPDLLAFIPYAYGLKRRGEWLVTLEVKAARGRLSPAQQVFAAHCGEADVTHLIGGLDVVLDWALAQGFIEGERTHYRIPRRSLVVTTDKHTSGNYVGQG